MSRELSNLEKKKLQQYKLSNNTKEFIAIYWQNRKKQKAFSIYLKNILLLIVPIFCAFFYYLYYAKKYLLSVMGFADAKYLKLAWFFGFWNTYSYSQYLNYAVKSIWIYIFGLAFATLLINRIRSGYNNYRQYITIPILEVWKGDSFLQCILKSFIILLIYLLYLHKCYFTIIPLVVWSIIIFISNHRLKNKIRQIIRKIEMDNDMFGFHQADWKHKNYDQHFKLLTESFENLKKLILEIRRKKINLETKAELLDNQKKNAFEILGISPSATQEEIKKTYRDLVQIYHPDKNPFATPEIKELAAEKFREITKAYDALIK